MTEGFRTGEVTLKVPSTVVFTFLLHPGLLELKKSQLSCKVLALLENKTIAH